MTRNDWPIHRQPRRVPPPNDETGQRVQDMVRDLYSSEAARRLLEVAGADATRAPTRARETELLRLVWRAREALQRERRRGAVRHWTYNPASHGQRHLAYGKLLRLIIELRQRRRAERCHLSGRGGGES